ncbi:DMT family transporter [Nocardia sp. NPDC051787]|uniref:DMT family transporter n=1 Tax=Nocardia sp. NPDC051787 TaxID=3155415 RepID=UPI003427E903
MPAANELGAGSVDAVATVTLALLAAFLFAVSAALQQGAARQAATDSGQGRFLLIATIARRVITDHRWLAGQGANVAGFAVHAVALRFGGIAVVQALLVVQLLFALPLAAVRRGRRLLARDRAGTTAVCAGLILLVAQGVSAQSAVNTQFLPEAGAGVIVTIVLLFGASRSARASMPSTVADHGNRSAAARAAALGRRQGEQCTDPLGEAVRGTVADNAGTGPADGLARGASGGHDHRRAAGRRHAGTLAGRVVAGSGRLADRQCHAG